MSANSDTRLVLALAESAGLTVEKTKHGGYVVRRGDVVVTRVRTGGNQPPHWVRSARRAIERAYLGGEG